MPVFPNRIPDLRISGPTIEIIILPPAPIVSKLRFENKPVPSKIANALIDTGASLSCIDDSIAKELNLVAHDLVTVCTPSGISSQPVYDLGFSMPSLTKVTFAIQVLGAILTAQPYDALIGRDILASCTFIYNGWDNSYQLHI